MKFDEKHCGVDNVKRFKKRGSTDGWFRHLNENEEEETDDSHYQILDIVTSAS